ncbi:MAG: peptide chain release factor 2 [Candidatus Babeliaceae bacterium]|nr:peptide chain release factor 2 [Candidatus Babeliaceae bacterium]
MIIDDLKEQLKSTEPDLKTIQVFWDNSHNQQEFERLFALSKEEDFWKNPQQIQISQQLQKIRMLKETYDTIEATQKEIEDLLILFKDDQEALESIKADISKHCRSIKNFKITLLLNKEDDDSNCFLSINAGAGGTESQDWSEMLLRMYVRFCEREKFSCTVLDYQVGEGAGIKSGTLYIKGKNTYGMLKNEQGIHRLVRISPFDSNKRRHTSFAGVFVTPETSQATIVINPNDLRIDTFRAGGAGGQHVNKTESAIRITHIPTGIVVQCQNERSQTQNKETAMKMLMAKLVQKEKEEAQAKLYSAERKKIEWGSQIRSYVLHPYKMVKDHRTNFESPQPEIILDGDLVNFIEAELIRSQTE